MILSASRRTDIPAFYSEWFMNRLRMGYLLTRNPFNPAQIRRIDLSPQKIDCIVFWTKDPAPLLSALDEIDKMGYRYYFQFTLTPYDRVIERNLRPKEELIETFVELSKRLGRNRLFWRYDPIILNDSLTTDFHVRHFTELCERLCTYTNNVTISFVDLYHKLKTSLIREIAVDEIIEVSRTFSNIAEQHRISVRACCEQTDLSQYGIHPASCIDHEVVETLCGHTVVAKPDKNQRPGCGCISSVDVGVYNTCKNGCVYCYANYSLASVEANSARHNPMGDFLIESTCKEGV